MIDLVYCTEKKIYQQLDPHSRIIPTVPLTGRRGCFSSFFSTHSVPSLSHEERHEEEGEASETVISFRSEDLWSMKCTTTWRKSTSVHVHIFQNHSRNYRDMRERVSFPSLLQVYNILVYLIGRKERHRLQASVRGCSAANRCSFVHMQRRGSVAIKNKITSSILPWYIQTCT